MKNEKVSQSPEAFDPKRVAIVAAAGTVIALAAVGVAWWLTPWSRLPRTRAEVDPYGTVAGLEVGPIRGVARGQILESRAIANIHGLGWTDPDAGLAHIPIDRAMDMIARGCRPPGAGQTAFEASVDPACSTAPPPANVADEVPPRSREGSVRIEPVARVEPLNELRRPASPPSHEPPWRSRATPLTEPDSTTGAGREEAR